jgi:ankyrin repeat protein
MSFRGRTRTNICTPFNCCLLPSIAILLGITIALFYPLPNQQLINAIKDNDIEGVTQYIDQELFQQQQQCMNDLNTDSKDCQVSVDLIDCGSGRSALHTAVQYSQSEIIDVLMTQYHSNIHHIKPNDLRQPIHIAAAYSNVDVVRQLVNTYDADIHAKAYDDWTPLLYAVLWSNVEILEFLLSKGAHANDTVNNGHNALQLSIVYSDVRIPVILIEHGATLLPTQRYYDDYIRIKRRMELRTQ